MRHHESEELAVQISAYLDNEFDVGVLMEDAETKTAAVERVAEVEDELGRVNELLQELEVEAMARQVEFENIIDELKREISEMKEQNQKVSH